MNLLCNPQPVKLYQQSLFTYRYLIPVDPDNLEAGGLYFSYPIISCLTDKIIPCVLGKHKEIKLIGDSFYWID